jgi:hypothetical protein
MLRRIFESSLLAYLNSSPISKLHHYQAGFQIGFSTITHSIVSHDCFKIVDQNCKSNRIFIDLKQAYDRVVIPILLKKLEKKNASKQLISLIDSLFMNCFSTINVNGITTPSFSRQRGLFQGSLLSPILFNIYINDLAEQISKTSNDNHIPSTLLFADDIQLLPKSLTHANEMIRILNLWCLENDMEINVSKSAFVGISNWSFKINEIALPTTESYNYLGLPTTAYGIDWNLFISKSSSKALNSLKFLQVHGDSWPPLIRLTLFKSFIRSAWEYGAPMISTITKPNDLKPLQEIQNTALAWVINVGPNQGRIYQRLIRSLTGIESVSERFKILSIRFGQHYTKCISSNPIVQLVKYFNSNNSQFTSSSLIRNQIHYPAGFKKYIREKSTIPPGNALTLNQAMKIQTLKNLSKILTKNDRISLIKSESRHENSLADVSLYIKPKFFANQAIRWRLSSLMFGQKCPVCSERFFHTHVVRCLNMNNPDELFKFELIPQLIKQLKQIMKRVNPDYLSSSYN